MEFDFFTKVAGVTFEGRQHLIASLCEGERLVLERQPHNPHDRNAIGVFDLRGRSLGFIRKELAPDLARQMDSGVNLQATVASVTGGDAGFSYGLNIRITTKRKGEVAPVPHSEGTGAIKVWDFED